MNKLPQKFWPKVAALGFLLMTALMWKLNQKITPFAVVDITRAIQEPSRLFAASKLNKEAQQKAMRAYSNLLPKVIEDYEKTHRLTIISAYVLAGHNRVDITNEITALTIARMKHGA